MPADGHREVDRGVQRLRGFQDGPELLFVQVLVAGVGVDDDAVESEPADPAFDFSDRAGRHLRCDCGQTGVPVEMARNRFGE